jgi:succinate dehydrogenase/fumarate reductase flavoprotein subunit
MATSAEQASQLANLFLELSESVDQFRETNAASLSDDELDSLVERATQLREISQQLNGESIAATLDQVQDNVNHIIAATKDAQQAVKKIKKVQNVFAIVSAATDLGAAIGSGKIATIGSSSAALFQAIAAAVGGTGTAGSTG